MHGEIAKEILPVCMRAWGLCGGTHPDEEGVEVEAGEKEAEGGGFHRSFDGKGAAGLLVVPAILGRRMGGVRRWGWREDVGGVWVDCE